MKGFRTWRAAACDRCHGANQQGLVGPSLIERLKTLSKAEFVKTVTEGRLDKGMPSFNTSKMVMTNMDHLYAYLKGRSDGAITRSKVGADTVARQSSRCYWRPGRCSLGPAWRRPRRNRSPGHAR